MRKIVPGRVGLAFLFLFATSVGAQSPPVPQLRLSVTNTAVVQGLHPGNTMGFAGCDNEGDVYLRLFNLRDFESPVVRISADGETTKTFSAATVPGFQQAQVDAFAVAPDGEVGLAVWGPKLRGSILMFKTDGMFDSDATIDLGPVVPWSLAIFSNGNLLVSGVKEAPSSPIAPVSEVLNDAGQIVKELVLPGDYSPPKPSDPTFKESFYQPPAAITLGTAVSGTDGNVYLLRHFARPTVYVVAPDGSLLRKLVLAPPKSAFVGGAVATAYGELYYSSSGGGQLAVLFSTQGPISAQGTKWTRIGNPLVSIYDAQDGKRLFDYELPPQLGDGLACYTPNGFTFIGSTKQRQFALQEARPD